MFIYNQKSLTLISLETYCNYSEYKIAEDDTFIKLRKYTEYVQQYSYDTNLQIIALEVEKTEAIFKLLDNNKIINWLFIEDLSKSKDTFEFSIQNIGLNFNDLYEHLDEFSYITSATISDMNSVSNYFNNLF